MFAIVVHAFACLGGIFFGNDQGVTGGILAMKIFLSDICACHDSNSYGNGTSDIATLHPNRLSFMILYNALFPVGCFLVPLPVALSLTRRAYDSQYLLLHRYMYASLHSNRWTHFFGCDRSYHSRHWCGSLFIFGTYFWY